MGFGSFLQQVVDALAQSAHVLYEVALPSKSFLRYCTGHDAHRVGSQVDGTIDRTHHQCRLRDREQRRCAPVVATLHRLLAIGRQAWS